MLQTLKNAWKTQELKSKLLFTLLIVILYRLGSAIPVPWISNASDIAGGIASSFNVAIQLIAGDAFGKASLFALSVSPYITSSIIIQLLTIAIPALERMAKDGEEGKKKINVITRIVTMILALITAVGYTGLVISSNMTSFTLTVSGNIWYSVFASGYGLQFIVMVACYCAGAALVMWLAKKINEFGIGNGISVILFANIIARLPNTLVGLFTMVRNSIMTLAQVTDEHKGDAIFQLVGSIIWALFVIALLIALVWIIV
jgi:preprotein translocase subunit SecY